MKFLIILLLTINPLTDIDKIAKVNAAKKKAEQQYLAGDYEAARDTYTYLIDSLGVKDERAILNLANSQYHLQDTINSLSNYKELTSSTSGSISSKAYAQLGEIAFEKKQYEPALQHYKQALKKDPANSDARYNYELLKKLIEEQQQQQQQDQQNQDQQNQDQQNQDQQNKDQQQEQENQENQEQEQKDQQQEQQDKEGEEKEQENQQEQQQQDEKEGEEKEEPKENEQQKPEEGEEQEKEQEPQPSPEDKLKELNISEEKAKMILEAMKNNEIQYIQQNKRKAKKKKDPDKPDW